ncbi:MAG TPA: DUF4440 domain-containing protein [Gemmatimonadales bacterium]|jgi:uncharacterized protein (TIGR02246 family)
MRATPAFAALALLACQPAASPPPGFTDADRQAIEAQHTAWSAAANAGDRAALTALYTEDATVMPPNSPAASGRVGVRQVFDAFPPVGDTKLTSTDVVGTAESAVVRGVYSMNLMLPGATAAVADTGKFIELWRKQADGTWLISWDIWNSDIAAPAPEPAKKP